MIFLFIVRLHGLQSERRKSFIPVHNGSKLVNNILLDNNFNISLLSFIGPILSGNVHATGAATENKVKQQLSFAEQTGDTTKVSPRNNLRLFLSLTIGSLGIIFGDIGTSPLYVVHTIFTDNLNPTHQQCIGAISLIIWNLIIVVSIKYAIFILMADNRGEGGTFALCGLLTGENSKLRARAKHIISIVSILAASLLIGKRRS